jgi:hypothetical protein
MELIIGEQEKIRHHSQKKGRLVESNNYYTIYLCGYVLEPS